MLAFENTIGKSGNARNDHARSQKQRNNALSDYFPQHFNLNKPFDNKQFRQPNGCLIVERFVP